MKKLILLLSLSPLFSFAQQVTNTWDFDGQTRKYLSYVPASYDGSEAVPVVFAFHGLGDNMTNFAGIGMNYVADTANFIVITPEALVDQLSGSTAWNSGASAFGFVLNGNVDDIGFVGAILDTLIANYNIDQTKVFATGFSMGGFMTNRIGCELNDRFAAIASVAGTIGSGITCSPGRAVPACHFHGTGDGTIAYTGNSYGNDAEALALFWAGNNNCTTTPTVTTLPDIATDNYIVTHKLFDACNEGADVELFRVDSADHVWLSPANDIFYTTEIWKFFMRHAHESVDVTELNSLEWEVYPNPTSDNVTIQLEDVSTIEVSIVSIDGKTLYSNTKYNSGTVIDISTFADGIYSVILSNEVNQTTKSLVKN